MKRKLKTALIAGMMGLASILPAKSKAINTDLEYVATQETATSYPRGLFYYNLPGDLSGFSFMELYQNGGYFGETSIEKKVADSYGIVGQFQHCDTPLNRAGIGISAKIPTPKGTFLKLTGFPIFVQKGEGREKNTAELAYFASADLPWGFKFTSFGDLNLADKNGVQWDYGEIDVRKAIGKGISLGYNPALLNDGNASPEIQHRITARASF